MPQWLGGPEFIVIVLIVVILFGWKKLPDAARSLGRSMRILKAEVEEMRSDDKPSAASQTTVPGQTVPPTAQKPTDGAKTTAPAETPEQREARIRAEVEAKIRQEETEKAERARIEAQVRAEFEAKHRAETKPESPRQDPAR
ncbi:sec-independent protein translocase protein TatA [Austwickia chelonae]|uniref:Sec-independent protein translocase protein TatA n=1 Tax=Austwickia chelonae NBRC 105200 TaxID=1184607 RepID=K6V4S6_9MICO|nr:Sec-independent protein translocase subunit TatA [Austwickia chelonae]GAB77163.1 Sec-independent protein translocase protein TatA/E homolog [Austwickia chelonae NBRC 105200]SEW04207.1 sec-independent protein translocase protein TatA [Austwickia chelonae]